MDTRRMFASVGLGVVMMMVVGACGGETHATLADYAEAATATAGTYVEESQTLSLAYQTKVERLVSDIAASGSAGAMSEAVEVIRVETTAFLAMLDDSMDRYVLAMDDMDPPTDVKELHDDYVRVASSVHAALPAMRDAVGKATSIADVEAALRGSTFADAQPAWIAACLALEQGVRDLGQGIELKCAKTEIGP